MAEFAPKMAGGGGNVEPHPRDWTYHETLPPTIVPIAVLVKNVLGFDCGLGTSAARLGWNSILSPPLHFPVTAGGKTKLNQFVVLCASTSDTPQVIPPNNPYI